MKKRMYQTLATALSMALILTASPALTFADEQNSDELLSVSGNEITNQGYGYTEKDGEEECSGWDSPLAVPNWDFTERAEIFKTRQIYLVKGKIHAYTLNQNLCSIKITDKSIIRAYDSSSESFFESKDRLKNAETYALEKGYAIVSSVELCGEEVGRTTIMAYGNRTGQGDVIEAIVVEPYIAVDASDSYKIAENESFSFDVDYTGDFGIAVSDKEVADFAINGKTVTVTGKKKGTVDFKLVQLKDDLTFNDVYSSVSGSTPESKSISVTVGTDAKLSASVTSLSLNAGESKDFTVSGTVKGVTNALKQTSFSLYNSTGNKKVADVVIGSVSGTNQKVTVKAVSGLSDTIKVNLTLKDTYTGTSFSIPVTISPAGTTVSPTVKPTTNPTVKPTVTPPVKKMSETVIVKKVASSVTIKKGKTVKATSNYKVSDKSKVSKVTYKTSNKKVASISKSGKIKGVKKGNAKITVTIVYKDQSTKKLTFKVKVK